MGSGLLSRENYSPKLQHKRPSTPLVENRLWHHMHWGSAELTFNLQNGMYKTLPNWFGIKFSRAI